MHPDNAIELKVERRSLGRYRAIVHDGKGNELRSTPFGKNKITNRGFEFMLTLGNFYLRCCAGSGNAPAQESDTTLQSYRGAAGTVASIVRTTQSDPSVGPLWWRVTTRFTFSQGAFGASSVNIAEAGMQFSASASFTSSTQLGSRGLLVDGADEPVAVAVAPDEFLDIVWEYTEYLPYDSTSTAVITDDGVPVEHTFTYRPMIMIGDSNNYTWNPWIEPGGGVMRAYNWFVESPGNNSFQGVGFMLTNGELGPPSGFPINSTFNGDRAPQVVTARAYSPGSKERIIDVTWTLTKGNVPAPGATIIKQNTGHACWQIGVNPPIAKVASKQLNLVLKLSMANMD